MKINDGGHAKDHDADDDAHDHDDCYDCESMTDTPGEWIFHSFQFHFHGK